MINPTQNDITSMTYQAEALLLELKKGAQGSMCTGYVREKIRNIAGILEDYDGIGIKTVTKNERSVK